MIRVVMVNGCSMRVCSLMAATVEDGEGPLQWKIDHGIKARRLLRWMESGKLYITYYYRPLYETPFDWSFVFKLSRKIDVKVVI